MIRYQKLSYSDAKVIIAEYDSYDDNEFSLLRITFACISTHIILPVL